MYIMASIYTRITKWTEKSKNFSWKIDWDKYKSRINRLNDEKWEVASCKQQFVITVIVQNCGFEKKSERIQKIHC